jgi:hypothetical protein
MKRLNHAPDAPEIKEVLVRIRHLLLGRPDGITPGELIHFSPPGNTWQQG